MTESVRASVVFRLHHHCDKAGKPEESGFPVVSFPCFPVLRARFSARVYSSQPQGTAMTLAQRLEADYLSAYKAKDAVRLSVLRLLKTAMKNLLVERMQKPLDDGDILDLIAKQCKQRQDSITQFTAANRPDLSEKEERELLVLQEYMPEQIQGEALKELVRKLAAETGASGARDMGKVMQALTAGYKGQYDGKEASALVRDVLSQG